MAPHMVIVFPFTTTVTISSLPTPLPTSLESLLPSYNARPDGSLITSRYMREINDTNVRLFTVGLLLMLFTRNAVVSTDYLYRSRSKDKTLFYLLVVSQALGPVCFISLAVSYLSSKAHCRAVYMISLIATSLSQSFLITGILGIKAYRCLDQSRIVLSIISILQAASTVILCYDASRLRSHRIASGSCDVTSSIGNFPYVPISIILLFMQALFVCLCFVYTVWKASAYSAAQGRMSLAVSLETVADECDHPPLSPAPAELPGSRGWWDYVPQPRHDATDVQRTNDTDNGVFGQVSRLFGRVGDPLDPNSQRKPSITTEKPLPHLHRSLPPLTEHHSSPPRVTSQCPSLQQRWGGRLSRMRFVRAAMRDELAHAATVALNSIITVILIVISLFIPNFTLGPLVWLGVNWMVTSVVVMHSFSRVVKRHEREAILREPNTWDSMAKHAARRAARRTVSSPISIASRRRHRRLVDADGFTLSHSPSWSDPFRSPQDVEGIEDNMIELADAEPSSPPPTSGPDFLPNHYPERIVPQPLESPTQ